MKFCYAFGTLRRMYCKSTSCCLLGMIGQLSWKNRGQLYSPKHKIFSTNGMRHSKRQMTISLSNILQIHGCYTKRCLSASRPTEFSILDILWPSMVKEITACSSKICMNNMILYYEKLHLAIENNLIEYDMHHQKEQMMICNFAHPTLKGIIF